MEGSLFAVVKEDYKKMYKIVSNKSYCSSLLLKIILYLSKIGESLKDENMDNSDGLIESST